MTGLGLDYCPTCRRHIFDYDPAGREDRNGQRHCAEHVPATCEGHQADATVDAPLPWPAAPRFDVSTTPAQRADRVALSRCVELRRADGHDCDDWRDGECSRCPARPGRVRARGAS